MTEGVTPITNSARAAELYSAAVRDTALFIGQLDGTPGPQDVVMYATLVAREEAAHAQRRDALAAIGLSAQSVESGAEE